MNQMQFTRRALLGSMAGVAAAAAAGRIPEVSAAEDKALKIWANPIHKVGAPSFAAVCEG